MGKRNKGVTYMFAAFVLINSLLFLCKHYFIKNNIDFTVLMAANLVLFFITLIILLLSLRAVHATHPNAFTQSMYLGMIIKLFGCGIAAFIYIYMNDGRVNRAALLLCIPLYIIYTAIETTTLRTALKDKKNA